MTLAERSPLERPQQAHLRLNVQPDRPRNLRHYRTEQGLVPQIRLNRKELQDVQEATYWTEHGLRRFDARPPGLFVGLCGLLRPHHRDRWDSDADSADG